MSAVCSRCSIVFAPPGPCPRCGAPLPLPDIEEPKRSGPYWKQTAWGQLVVGLIFAQGLFYGLRHLLTGILLATTGSESATLWDETSNLLLLQAVQMLAVFSGGVLAAGGRQHGLFLGMMVGAWNGILAVMLRQNPAQEMTLVVLYGQPLLHAAFGSLGGWMGAHIWQPLQPTTDILLPNTKPKAARPKQPLFAGKVAWFRVLAGTSLVVLGTLYATMLLRRVMEVSGGVLATSYQEQDRIIAWEIKALAAIVGGALAGATTTNGFKQGLFVGLGSSIILIGIQAPPDATWFQAAGLIAISTMSLSTSGGWFGGQLFPRIVKRGRRGMQGFV
jgi:hypothetical protein